MHLKLRATYRDYREFVHSKAVALTSWVVVAIMDELGAADNGFLGFDLLSEFLAECGCVDEFAVSQVCRL